MATTTNITTTYAGEFAGQYIGPALLSAETIENGGVTVKPNIKYKEVVKRVDTDGILKDSTCDFTPTSTVTIDERVLEPKKLQVNLQQCKETFESDWEAIQMGYSAFSDIPPTYEAFILGWAAAKVADANESSIWTGDETNSGEYDGFETLFAADGSVLTVDNTAITSANVVTELGKIVDALPAAVYKYRNEDLLLFVSDSIFRAYVRALGGFGANGLGANGYNNLGNNQDLTSGLMFDGIKVFYAPGLTSGNAVLARKSNLWFGTGLMSDWQEVKLLDMADLDGSQNFRIIMRMTAGVQYGFSDEIVYYRPAP